MKEGYRLLGDFIRQVDVRNTDGKEENLLGVSVQKIDVYKRQELHRGTHQGTDCRTDAPKKSETDHAEGHLSHRRLSLIHICSVVFNPCLPDGVINEAEAKWA